PDFPLLRRSKLWAGFVWARFPAGFWAFLCTLVCVSGSSCALGGWAANRRQCHANEGVKLWGRRAIGSDILGHALDEFRPYLGVLAATFVLFAAATGAGGVAADFQVGGS